MQGRFKRDGSSAAEQEPRGGNDRGSSPQHTPNPAQGAAGEGGDSAVRSTSAGGPAPEPAAAPKAKSPNDAGPRIALRNWRISTRLVSLLALPVVAATTLGGIRINESLQDMEQLEHMQLLTKLTKEATDLAEALQAERDLSAGPLSNGASPSEFKVADPRKKTDRARTAFLDATGAIGDTMGDDALESIRTNANQIAQQVVTLDTLRQTAYKGNEPTSQTVEQYSRIINSLLSLSQDMAQATSNPEMIKRTRALAAFSQAKEYASIQQAIIAASLPPTDQQLGKLDRQDRLYAEAARRAEKTARTRFETIYESTGGNAQELTESLESGNSSVEAANAYAERVLSTDSGLSTSAKRGYLDFTDEYGTKMQAMSRIEGDLLGKMETEARELKQESQRDALINGALILLVLGVSLVGAFVVARSMIRSLRRLQDTATKVAQERLPELVKQLSEADPQDVDTSVESVGVHSRDEIGQVAEAFDEVHREAVRLAAEQAMLRGNVNAMFTNLSRRSQGLIQRQLSLISELESREADPDQLSSLFKLDHLATRMRRNGENLLVLAGEEPGRRWTRPVPLVDVLRAAASEVEQYERIELAAVPATEVAGRVVNDLVHLLAELLENATSFSSPQTKVRVTGHALPDGRVLVEIHDTGIGLSPEDLAAINERLASPPTVDVSVSRRMGLFVVGRLSLRHGIRIQLRPSDSGGTTALVMLPVDVAQGGRKPAPKQGAGGQGQVPQGQGAPGGRLAAGPGAAAGLGGAGRLGAGSGPRAALPGRDGARPNGPQNPQNPQGQSPQAPQAPQRQGAGFGGGAKSAIPSRTDVWQNSGPGQNAPAAPNPQAPQAPQPAHNGFQAPAPARPDQGRPQQGQGGPADGGRRPGLPGGPRAELPGAGQPQRPQTPSWGNDRTQPPQRQSTPLDAPRGHEEPETTGPYTRSAAPQGPHATGQFARPELPQPQGYQTGRQDPAATAAFQRPDFNAPQPPAPRQRAQEADFGAPRPAAGLPAAPQPEALPPASGGGDGRTPLYDTLETNWFRGQQAEAQRVPEVEQTMPTPVVPQQPQQQRQAPAAPRRPAAPQQQAPQSAPQQQAPQGTPQQQAQWRTSPNDDLVRQAERARKPSAGGVTTSGLPRRVPRANLVPGTAQEQAQTAGPQVSRAPDDVRGRLTNLRRGIQQGRQAGNSNTGSFNIGPTHQQEREF
ncbi:nitrate- and nitrite sensing domain-containing protein [Streptomyces sp. NPDC048604]|uniref:sensor histidine kinase n=1 Tax=Streptomyces sp. NPDC048604 TaxID=3365578 RepID=UPI00371E7E5E